MRPPHRYPNPVLRTAEVYARVPYLCRACGWGGELGVRGAASNLQMPTYVGGERDAERKASALASRLAGPDARASAELARCPACGERDSVALGALHTRAKWRLGGVVLLLAVLRVCAGAPPWWSYGVGIAFAAALGFVPVVLRLRRADRAVFFSHDGVTAKPGRPPG